MYSTQATIFDDNWVVVRLSIAVVLISYAYPSIPLIADFVGQQLTIFRAFIVANIATHIPQRDDIERDSKADVPDLSPERARSNIIGYIFGVTPGLAIWIVFGLTKDFRQIMYETFVPRSWRRRWSTSTSNLDTHWDPAYSNQPTDLSGVAVDTGLQLDNIQVNPKRRSILDTTDVS